MAAGDVYTYDPDQVVVTIAGLPITGWADGEFIKIEPETDAFADVVGTSGEVTRSKSNDRRHTCSLKLMQSSPANDLLSALHTSDLNTPGGVGIGPFLVKDGSGRSLHVGEKCWISKAPPIMYDRTPTEREWTIRIARLDGLIGGN
jgi:hypothetical protein